MRIYTLCLMIVFCGFCKAQNKLNLPPGTGPSSITRNIAQDRKGNLWFASWEGVFRLGKTMPVGQTEFTNITSKVTSARFFSVLVDRKDNLWFGTIGSGVYFYDGKSFQNFTTKEGLPNNEITCIYQDKLGNIWFGVNGGASRYDGVSFRNYMIDGDLMSEDKTGKTVPDFTRPPNEVSTIIEDKAGKFWFGTRGKAFMYDGKAFTIVTHNGTPFANVRTIIQDKKGNIWFGGPDGLWRYDGNLYTNFTKNFVGYVYEDKKGNLWTGSESDNHQSWALSRYDAKSLSAMKPTVIINDKSIFGIMEDDKENIWYGTGNGVYRYDGNTITDFKTKDVQK